MEARTSDISDAAKWSHYYHPSRRLCKRIEGEEVGRGNFSPNFNLESIGIEISVIFYQ